MRWRAAKRVLSMLGLLAVSATFALLACIGLWTVIRWVTTGGVSW